MGLHFQMTTQPRLAPLKLRFVVVGGSLGGLAVAFALARAGHNVHVVEQRESLVKVRRSTLSSFCPRSYASITLHPIIPAYLCTDGLLL